MANDEFKMSKQDLIEIVSAAVAASNQLNPIEQRKYEQELEAQKRRDLAALQLAKIEEESRENKKRSCTHNRHEKSGHPVQKDSPGAQWLTSGQANSTELVTLICQRCSYVWQWKPTAQEYAQIEQNGLMGWAPPDSSRLIYESVAGN